MKINDQKVSFHSKKSVQRHAKKQLATVRRESALK